MNRFCVFSAFLAALSLAASCVYEDVGDYGNPILTSNSKTVVLGAEAGSSASLCITPSRSWTAMACDSWFKVLPSGGLSSVKPITVMFYATQTNTGYNRKGSAIFEIPGKRLAVTVIQLGYGGDLDADAAFRTNFNFEADSLQSDTLAHTFPLWRKAGGAAASNARFGYDSLMVSTAQPSDDEASSAYWMDASGGANLLFPTDTSFLAVHNLIVADSTDFLLSWGSLGGIDAYVGNSASRFVKLDFTREGTSCWALNHCAFSVPDGTDTLALYFKGKGRLDDVCLAYLPEGEAEPEEIDFTAADSLDVWGLTYVPEPQEPEEWVLYSESLASGRGSCLTTNSDIWKHGAEDSCMVARGYFDGALRASNALLTTPGIAVPDTCRTVTFSFEHAVEHYQNLAGARKALSVEVEEYGSGEWKTLEVGFPENTDGSFAGSGDISLDAYAGKTIRLGFRYTSTTISAGIWKVRKLLLTKEKETINQ